MTPRRRFDVDELDLFNEPPHFKNRDDGSSERSSFATYLGNEVFTAYRGALGENADYDVAAAGRDLAIEFELTVERLTAVRARASLSQ
jgi:hypothetical protein